MANKTNIKQTNSKVVVQGILSEKNLTFEDDVVKGSLTIQTSDVNFVTFNVYQAKMTKAGKPNMVYTGLETINSGYKTIAEVGLDEATRVSVTKGEIAPETYFDAKGKHDRVKFKSSFFSRMNAEDITPQAKFEQEVYIKAIIPEIKTTGEDAGEETGRAIVRGWTVDYNGELQFIELIAPVEDGIADAVLSSFAVGQTVEFYGDIQNNRITKEEIIPVKIGKPKINVTTVYKNELVITNASEEYEEGVFRVPYDADVIKKAEIERESSLIEKENKAKGVAATTGASNGQKPTTATNRALPTW